MNYSPTMNLTQWRGMILILVWFMPVFLMNRPSWFPAYFSNAFFLAVILCASGCLLVFYSGLKGGDTWRWTRLDLAAGLFVVYFLIRFAFSTYGHWIQGKFVWWIALFLMYVLFRVWLSRGSHRFSVWTGLMLIALAQIVIGEFQLLGILPAQHDLFKISGTFFNPAPYSGFLAVIFPLALHAALSAESNRPGWTKTLASLVVAGSLLVIAPAQSRAAWLALLAGGTWILADRYNVLNRLRQRSRGWIWSMALLMIGCFLVGSYLLYQLKPDSASGRLLIWKASIPMLMEQPVFGHGPARFGSEYMIAQSEYFASGRGTAREELLAGHVNFAYNEFLQLGVELGFFGLFLFLSVLGLAFLIRRSMRSVRRESGLIPWQAALLGWCIFACFSYPLAVWGTALSLVLILAGLSGYDKPVSFALPLRVRLVKSLVGTGALIAAFMLSLWFGYAYPARNHWENGFNAYLSSDYEKARNDYLQAFDVLQYEGLYLQHVGKCFSLLNQYEESNHFLELAEKYYNDPVLYTTVGGNDTALQNYQEAEAAYLKAHYMIPHRIYPRYLLAQMYYTSQQRSEAANLARELLTEEIKVRSPATNEMINQLKVLSMVDF